MAGERRALGALIAADGISRAGNVLTVTAIPWYVLVTTGSAGRTGMTVFAGAVAVVVSLFFGGVVVDRLGYRRASIVGDLASGSTVAMIPLLDLTVGLEFWQLLLLVFTGALLDLPAEVARYSALPDLATAAGVRFERANSMLETAISASSLLGPALAGLLIASLGARNVLWLDVMTFGVSALLVFGLVPAMPSAVEARSRGYLTDLVDGLRFVRGEPLLFPLILFFALMNLAVGPAEAVFIPVYAHQVFDSAVTFGFMAAALATGSLAGTAIFGAVGHRLSRRGIFCGGFLAVPLALLLLALLPDFVPTLLILAGMGAGLALTNGLEYTIYFERIPSGMRARVLGITGAIGWFSVPLGRLIGGFLLEWLSLGTTLALVGLLFLPAPLAIFAFRAFRDMSAPDEAGEPLSSR